jgi:RHH-type proline utilization regulon transcriptional repressor/proline dehydrogenase/delta 1-pyrroline-5-carboxylate dehydrogenase
MTAPSTENRTHEIGREIFTRINQANRRGWPLRAIDDAMMAWSMRDPRRKSQLFRFVDCLPALHSADSVASHLHEYLGISTSGMAPLLAAAARLGVGRMARKFIAAENPQGALSAIQRLRAQHLAFTVDLLGEAVVSESEADEYQRRYLQLLQFLPPKIAPLPEDPLIDRDATTKLPRANISVKLSALFSQFDPIDPFGTTQSVLARLRPILRLARSQGAFINLDMEQYAFKDLTLEIFQTVLMEPEFRDWPHIGIAMQAYLRSTGR